MHADTVIPPEYLDKLRIIVLPSEFVKIPAVFVINPAAIVTCTVADWVCAAAFFTALGRER